MPTSDIKNGIDQGVLKYISSLGRCVYKPCDQTALPVWPFHKTRYNLLTATMHTSLALLVLAVCLSSAVGVLNQCDNYKPFVKNWICPSKSIKYNPFTVNGELINGLPNGAQYDGSKNVEGTAECVKDIPKPEPFIARVPSRTRIIKLEELCAMKKVYVHNVYKDLTIGGVRKQYECVVVNTGWMRQDLYYAECVNPQMPDNDMCQLDYGTRKSFRCVQSGFVKKRVLLLCPDHTNWIFTTHTVPTTCSCRRCPHCENVKDDMFSNLLEGLMNPTIEWRG
ncbi:uncharacterized protein LOC110453127 [Mizuhopecten yessoensis]|uniref:Spaetzle domain-containing protein n=1 Tax=Mizuhopecten yessoensis TaxID=6573 RepID=A0A210R4N0_MIZYE|nr:uncharacterized protein LOC110453127 [Mizuhopecten yessoensis]OWF55969.1 hypothetical protein KP79_PYT06711 [Mizuhopecten yessoensis]